MFVLVLSSFWGGGRAGASTHTTLSERWPTFYHHHTTPLPVFLSFLTSNNYTNNRW